MGGISSFLRLEITKHGVNREFDKKATKHSVVVFFILITFYLNMGIFLYLYTFLFFFVYVKSIGSVFSRLNRERCLCTLVRSKIGRASCRERV